MGTPRMAGKADLVKDLRLVLVAVRLQEGAVLEGEGCVALHEDRVGIGPGAPRCDNGWGDLVCVNGVPPPLHRVDELLLGYPWRPAALLEMIPRPGPIRQEQIGIVGPEAPQEAEPQVREA